jgi:hypothetical protein
MEMFISCFCTACCAQTLTQDRSVCPANVPDYRLVSHVFIYTKICRKGNNWGSKCCGVVNLPSLYHRKPDPRSFLELSVEGE